MRKGLGLVVFVAAIVSAAAPAVGQEKDFDAALKAMEARLNAKIDALQQQQGTVSKDELKKAILAELQDENLDLKVKEWLKGLTIYGDLRLRYEGAWPDSKTAGQRTKARHRARMRVRVGLKKQFLGDQMEVVFRAASGGGTTSTNQTMTGTFSGKGVFIDQAFAVVKPEGLPGLTLYGGKVANPLPITPSGMVWDSDVNPEGFYAKYDIPCGSADNQTVTPWVSAGYFILTETANAGHDVTMTSGGLGATVKVGENTSVEAAAQYLGYDFHGAAVGAAATRAAGTRNWQVLNVGAVVKTKVGDVPVASFAEMATNLSNDDSRARTKDKDNAYALGVKIGKNKNKDDVSFMYKYLYMEMNSTPGAVSDGDFAGPNRKGHGASVVYNVTDSVTLGATLLHANPIVGVAPADSQNKATCVQIDMIWKF